MFVISEIWYRINTMGEKNLFLNRELIDGIVIPAHILAFYDPSLASFIRDIDLPFIIDPMTYVWNRSKRNIVNSSGVIKKSYQKYVKKLDCTLANILGRIDLTSYDNTQQELEEFVDAILSFQLTLGRVPDDPRLKSLTRIRSRRKKSSDEITPYTLIPPYFYFTNFHTKPYQLSLDAAQYAKTTILSSRSNVSPLICMSEGVIASESGRERLVNDYSDFTSVIFWVSAFNDRQANIDSLRNIRELVEAFHEVDIRTTNLYGSYFSVLMSFSGLERFSSGITISHQKAVDAIAGGGGMPLRYYDPTMKLEVLNNVAHRLYAENPELFICECPCCSDMTYRIQSTTSRAERESLLDPFFIEIRRDNREGKSEVVRPAHMNWTRTRLHFMHVRRNEINNARNSILSDLTASIMRAYMKLNRELNFNQYNRLDSVEHLRRWVDAL